MSEYLRRMIDALRVKPTELPEGFATASILDNWEFRPVISHRDNQPRALMLAGRVSGDARFASGETIYTSEIAAIDGRSSVRWARTRNSLYRLGAQALTVPLITAVGLANDWIDALILLAVATGDHTLDGAALAPYVRLLNIATSRDWAEKRLHARAMSAAMDVAQRILLRDAWTLLGADPRDQVSAQTVHGALKQSILNVDGAHRMHAEAVLEAWAAFASGNFLLFGDEQDHIAGARTVGEQLLRERRPPLFVRVALASTWRDAWSLAAVELPQALVDEATSRGIENAADGERLNICRAVAKVVGWGGDGEAWKIMNLLSINPASLISVNWVLRKLNEYPESDDSLQARRVWQALADSTSAQEEPVLPDDAFSSARVAFVSKSQRRREDEPEAAAPQSTDAQLPEKPSGVVVLPLLGGTNKTTSGKEVAQEFNSIVGETLPFATASDITLVRARLTDEFPHLVSQIDILLTGVVGGAPVRMRPTLLVGPHGGGKSRLVRRFSEVLDVPLHRFDGAGSADNAFSGTPRRWSSGEHCVPLEAIRRAGVANPIILVDEVDKAGKSHNNGSLDRALLPFLEPENARAYPDPYVQSECDLSYVNYLMTANDAMLLPAPLRDRLRIIELPQASIDHLPQLTRTIVAEIAAMNGGDVRWFPPLTDQELAIAERLWPGGSTRRLRAIVERLLAYREQNPRN